MKARDLTDGSLSGPKEDVDVTVEKVKAAKFFRTDVSISYPVLVGVQVSSFVTVKIIHQFYFTRATGRTFL